MRCVTVSIFLTLGTQTHGNELANAPDSMDGLVDNSFGKLTDRALKVWSVHANLDCTILAKAQRSLRSKPQFSEGWARGLSPGVSKHRLVRCLSGFGKSPQVERVPQTKVQQATASVFRPSKMDVEKFLQKSGVLDDAYEPFRVTDIKTLTTGYANFVYKVELENNSNRKEVIAKIYSGLAKCRQKPHLRGLVDRRAEMAALGPQVHYSDADGIVTEFLPGALLDASNFMGDAALRKDIAERLARLHALETPREEKQEPLIWCSCNAMTSRTNRDLMLPGFDLDELIKHVELYRSIVAGTSPRVVTGHGDLKPANIMRIGSPDLLHTRIAFIDFELAGPGYRGYDIFKLFRAQKIDEEKLRQFIIDYLQAGSPGSVVNECEVEKLYAEALMFEPLTYLEPVIFFNSAVSECPEHAEKFTHLARARWDMYLKTKHRIRERADALRALDDVCEKPRRTHSRYHQGFFHLRPPAPHDVKHDVVNPVLAFSVHPASHPSETRGAAV